MTCARRVCRKNRLVGPRFVDGERQRLNRELKTAGRANFRGQYVCFTSIPAGRSATSHVESLAAETSSLTCPLILERGCIVFRRASGNGDRLRTIVFHKGLCLGGGAGWHVRVNVAKAGLHNYLADQRCRLSFKNFRGRRSTRLPVRA